MIENEIMSTDREPREVEVLSACLHFDSNYGLLDREQREKMQEDARRWFRAWCAVRRLYGNKASPSENESRKGFSIVGKWPGDETDEEIQELLESLEMDAGTANLSDPNNQREVVRILREAMEKASSGDDTANPETYAARIFEVFGVKFRAGNEVARL